VVGRTEDETGISLIERLACPLDDRGKVAVQGERHQQTDQPGSSARQGTGAAMSVVVATIMIVISYLNFKFFRQRD